MRILSIGNSFSEDAQRWLHQLSLCGDSVIDAENLFIGGCSLETHCDCITNKKSDYDLQGNNIEHIRKVSVNEIIENEQFDVITIQQASGFSGIPQSYIPYVTEIADYVRKHQPNAKLYFHKTWSYDFDSTHKHFAFYNNNQDEMFRRISDCAEMVKKLINADVLPVGDFIQYLRENTDEFNHANGGVSLCRDGFHLSLLYGRFVASAVWYKEIAGEYANIEKFSELNTQFDLNLLEIIVKNLKEFYSGR